MKSYQLAAAVLTALAATTASAEYKEKTICVPVDVWGGKAEILSLCDASEVNKKYNLKLDNNGCAVAGQSLEKENGDVFDQSAVTVWGETDEEIAAQSLPMCDEFEAAAFVVEL